uniref:Uncharacterized protein n=1 Tax=Sphaerodactylus townsendi TaxID=933632 RepID=A0ACB8FJF1_9SAUR
MCNYHDVFVFLLMDKAGGYGIQALGGMLVEYVHGDFLNVVLFVSSKLKIFDLLKGKGAMTSVDVANCLKASVRGTERLLDACAALGLLEKTHQGYSNSDLANLYLVSDCEFSLHDFILHCDDRIWPLFTHLELAVKEGTSQNHFAIGKKGEDLFQDFYYQNTEMKQHFMSAMHSIAKMTARDVASAFDLSQFRVVCDLGGCTGALAHELTQIYPAMKVTVFDLPDVISSVSSFQPSRQNTGQISFSSGDFFKDNLPESELYILSRVLHDWCEEKIHALLSKLSAVCKPGSALLVAETVLDEKGTSPARAVLQSLTMTEGKQRSVLEYKQLLEKYGFTSVQIKITGNLLDVILCFKKVSPR